MTAPVNPMPFGSMGGPAEDPTVAALHATMQQSLHPEQMPPPPEASQANEIVAPNPPDQLADIPHNEQKKLLAAALYGSDFPAINENHQDSDWASWVRGRWGAHRGAVEKHLWLVERNRLFRAGTQWISSNTRTRSQWREAPKAIESSRLVYNVIDKALDQRLQISNDQRPGFHVEPTTADPDDKRKAEARQIALEYQYDQQNMDEQRQVADFWAQTDGVSFWQTFWDPDAGPWDERMGATPNEKKPLGDLRTRTLRCEQVRVSANATRTERPYYVIIREVIPATEAAYRYGVAGVNPNASALSVLGGGETEAGVQRWVLDQTTVGEGDRLRDQETVERYTIYVERQADILPDGLEMTVIGDSVVWGPGPLLFKMIPVVEVRDGSTDPSYYPRPIMEQWLDHQVRINALVSAVIDCIRVNKGGRFIGRAGAVVQETFIGGGTSLIEVNGAIQDLDQILKPVTGFSIGQDVKDQLELEIKAFENASGWNDQSRGQISGDASGRAILAAREQLERVFAPGVQSKARAFTKWADVQVAGMAFGYDIPRNLGAVGNDRPDLARELTREMFEGPSDVKVDAETLMPMPRVYRQFLLDGWLDKGLITPQAYMRRQPSAMTNDMDTPDEDQEARAQRVALAIRLGQPAVPEMRWQDNEAIHQDVLERQIILRDDLSPEIIQAAQMRWTQLAQQSAMKQGGMAPMPGDPMGGGGGGPPEPPNPMTQPTLPSNPSVAAAPPQGGVLVPGMGGQGGSQQDEQARAFESLSPQ